MKAAKAKYLFRPDWLYKGVAGLKKIMAESDDNVMVVVPVKDLKALSGGKVRLPKQVSWNQAVVIIGETDGTVAGSSPHDFTQGWAACLKEVKRMNHCVGKKGKGKS